MNKYYTPSIEEFRIGFEYELLAKESRYNKHWRFNTVVNIWLHKTFTKSNFEHGKGWDRFQDLDDEWIRVKYLDQIDIESCGFKRITEPVDVPSGTLNSNYFNKQRWDSAFNGCEIYSMDGQMEHEYMLYKFKVGNVLDILRRDGIRAGGPLSRRFEGDIKNLSELKVLLTQVGIKY